MLKMFLITLLLFIFFQDVKSRGVYWFLFPILMAIAFASAWQSLTADWLLNIGFLILMMAMLTLYVSLKEKKAINITKGYFSWGDILFLLAVTPLFSLHAYILFFTAGTILSLLIHLVVMFFRKQETIPYAGYMSLVLVPLLIFETQVSDYLMLYV